MSAGGTIPTTMSLTAPLVAVSLTSASPKVVPALDGVPRDRLAAAYAECAQVARERARNFYYGLKLTPEPRRSAIYSIYAWMRHADDHADAEGRIEDRRAALRNYQAITERILAGEAPSADLPLFWNAFAATIRSYPLDHGIIREMLLGLEEDLEHQGYDADQELWRYCFRVASTVGIACISIWGTAPGADQELVSDLAIRRGQAFQRTNILRDFAEDFDAEPSRVYLPREAFVRHAVTPQIVRAWSDPDRCRAFIAEQAAIARSEYHASAELERLIDPACAPTLWAMTRIYSGILKRIEDEPVRIVQQRIRLASARKASIAFAATWKARTGRW